MASHGRMEMRMAMSRPQVTDDAHECHGLGGRLSEEIKAWRVYVRAVFVRRFALIFFNRRTDADWTSRWDTKYTQTFDTGSSFYVRHLACGTLRKRGWCQPGGIMIIHSCSQLGCLSAGKLSG